MSKTKKETPTTRRCYKCKEKKPLKDMEDLGVWVCKKCLKDE
jgi:ribosomal protein L37AE/L43A